MRVGGERDTGGESGEEGARRGRGREGREDRGTERGELPSGKVRMCQLVGSVLHCLVLYHLFSF